MPGLTIDLQQLVPAAPEVVWALVADPTLMNRWCSARIESVAPGDGGHPASVGALRRVHLPHGLGVLTEVIERSRPLHLEYRVIAGAPIVNHHGAIEIAPQKRGSLVRWAITATPLVPGTGPFLTRLLRGELGDNLASLAAVAPTATVLPLPPPERDLDESGPLAAVQDAAEAVATEQEALATRLFDAGDDRGWFARFLHHVSMAVLDLARAGRFDHPSWTLRLVPKLHELFATCLDDRPEPHWARATEALRSVSHRSRFERALTALDGALVATIEDDSPRALAILYADHYGPRSPGGARCDYVRFRADYLRFADLYPLAAARLTSDVPRTEWPLRARLLDRMPDPVRIHWFDRRFRSISRVARRAFERGEGIAGLLESAGKFQ